MEERNNIILKHLYLVPIVIRNTHCQYHTKEEYDEFYQIGSLGLVKAMEKYDKTKSTKKYLYTCIRQEIMRYFQYKSTKSRYPTKRTISLNDLIGEDTELIELIPSNTNIEEEVITNETKNRIRKRLNKLKNTKYKAILFEYYGIDTNSKNLTEIAQKYGVSRQYIQQQIKRGLEQLRKELEKEFKNEKDVIKN